MHGHKTLEEHKLDSNVGADATYKACYLAHAQACELVSKVLKKLAEVEKELHIELALSREAPEQGSS